MAQALRQQVSSPLAKEGFLCPICLQDQGDANSLAAHFESAHNTEDNPDVLHAVKGFFGKAKKFFAFDDDEPESTTQNFPEQSNHRGSFTSQVLGEAEYFEPQDFGKTRNLTDFFKAIRDATVDRTVVECNKVIIRLSKLTGDDVPEEGPKRRAFEQSVVSWSEDSSANACSTCGKGFNIRRRRHHCRLCGGIMCDKCSDFLPFSQARLVSNAVTGSEVTVSHPTFLRRSNSNSSLNSLGSKDAGPTLRMCSKCRKLVELHNVKQQQRSHKPAIVVLYEQLQNKRVKSEGLRQEYLEMAFSLRSGETAHSLEKAAAIRQQLARLYNELEATSKRIVSLKGTDEEPLNGTVTKLQVNVRAYTISYIQECSATLPTLPDQQQLVQLVSQKEEERKRKIQKQLEHAKENARKHQAIKKQPVPQATQSSTDRKVDSAKVSAGWTPGDVDSRYVQDDDPMVQQMNIIRGYLKQAKQAERHDEIEMLEENLRHLEEEYYRQ